jgi:hypothetical protein
MDLGEHPDFHNDRSPAMVCLGTFSGGHAPPEPFAELVRVVRPGGYMIFTVRNDVIERFREVMDGHERAARWRLVEVTEPRPSVPGSDQPDGTNEVFACLAR